MLCLSSPSHFPSPALSPFLFLVLSLFQFHFQFHHKQRRERNQLSAFLSPLQQPVSECCPIRSGPLPSTFYSFLNDATFAAATGQAIRPEQCASAGVWPRRPMGQRQHGRGRKGGKRERQSKTVSWTIALGKKGEDLSEMSGRVLKTESGPRVDVRARGSALGAIDGAGLAHKPRIRLFYSSIPHGLTARIPGFHPGGPGSTPGVGNLQLPFWHNFTFFVGEHEHNQTLWPL